MPFEAGAPGGRAANGHWDGRPHQTMLSAQDIAFKDNPQGRPSPRRRRIMIVAGEASGDLHGGDLAREILALDPTCELFGIAGAADARGRRPRVVPHRRHRTGSGLTELASTIRGPLATMRDLRRVCAPTKPDLVILIDYRRVQPDAGGHRQDARACRCSTTSRRRYGRGGADASQADRGAPIVWRWCCRLKRNSTRRPAIASAFVGHPLLDASRRRRAAPRRWRATASARRAAAGAAARQPARRDPLPAAADGRGGADPRREHRPGAGHRAGADADPAELAEQTGIDLTGYVLSRATPIVSLPPARSRWSRRAPRRWKPRCSAARW